MKKKNKSLLDNLHLRAIWILPNSKYPNPRYCWDFDTVVACDLVVRDEMLGISSPPSEDEEFTLGKLLDECRELRR